MSMLPMEAGGRRPAFFDQPGLDQIVSMVLELAAELSVVRERAFILERVLAGQGQAVAEAIEAYIPTAEDSAALAKLRTDMISAMFRTLGREHRPVTADVAA